MPKDLQVLLPLKEVRFSLHTKSRQEALHLASTYTFDQYSAYVNDKESYSREILAVRLVEAEQRILELKQESVDKLH